MPAPDPDLVLLLALRRGDGAAFDEAYERYRPRIFGFLLRMTRRPEVAEELLQETFLRLASHGSRLPEGTCLRAWLFTVARNLFVSWRRWSLVDLSRLAILASRPTPDVVTPFQATQASQAVQALEAALGSLPSGLREVLLLVAVEGFEPQEAAAILHLSPEATRQRLCRARALLQARLPDLGG